MPDKTVPLSVRVSQASADFLANLDIPDATTPSDKLRALIREARQIHDGFHDYGECLSFQQQVLAPFRVRLREAENAHAMHSELLIQLANWLPETAAYLMANLGRQEGGLTDEQLRTLEQGMADRVFWLIEQVMRMGVTSRNPCYDTAAISDRSGPVVELGELVKSVTATKGETAK